MKPIYVPSGKAKEYGDYAINIYTGCPHRCFYCFAPNVIKKNKDIFHGVVKPRENIVEETKKQIEREGLTDKLVHLCFICDPYPTNCDDAVTREIIEALKESGNHVQILTKGDGSRDFDLLNENDWYGITYSCDNLKAVTKESGALMPSTRLIVLQEAKAKGIKTWVSFEPVIDAEAVLNCIRTYHEFFDKVKIGKLNYHESDIDWKKFGEEAESLCKELGLEYYIKESLREEMLKK